MEHVLHACPTRFLTQKTFVILKKRWPNKKLLLARRACSLLFSIGGALISGVPSSVTSAFAPAFAFGQWPMGQ